MNRAGKFVNNMPGDTSYQSFCPNPLPPVPGLEFDEDIIDIKHTSETLKISYNTTSTAVKTLVELGFLRETTNAARNRVFSYEAYLEILRNGT